MNISSDIGRSDWFEKVIDRLMIVGVCDSRETVISMFKLVLLTTIVFEDGSPSGRAEENAHSSSSAAGNGAGATLEV
jgi:hypothetical protein